MFAPTVTRMPGGEAGVASAGHAGAVTLIIPTLNEEATIAQVVGAVPRDIVGRIIVADGGSTDATAPRARAAGADVIDAGRGYGRACLAAAIGARKTPTSWCSWTATAPTIRARSQHWLRRSRAGAFDFVIGSRARGAREPGSMAWHQLAAGYLAGFGMRALYGVRYTDMCAFRAIRREALLRLGMTRNDLWVEHRDADAGRARRPAHSWKFRSTTDAAAAASPRLPAVCAERCAPRRALRRRSSASPAPAASRDDARGPCESILPVRRGPPGDF